MIQLKLTATKLSERDINKSQAMRPFLLPILIAFLVPVSSGLADNNSVLIENAWVQAVPEISDVTAAYMKITNLGATPLRLVGASSNAASSVDLMITTKKRTEGKEMLGMESVGELVIPAGGSLRLEPGGNHLMLMGLKAHPQEGATIALTLKFAPGDQSLDLQISVYKGQPQ